MVAIIINKVFPIGISEEEHLIIILYKVVKLWYSNYSFFFPLLNWFLHKLLSVLNLNIHREKCD